MPEFTYEAMARTGIRSQGTLVANSEREVMSMLDARGLLDDLVRAMLEVGLAKDDERQEATLMVRHATEGP